MVKILTINSEFRSASKLGFPTFEYLDLDDDIVIRWGNSYSFALGRRKEKEYSKVINPAKAIILNCHKLNALKKLNEVVSTPKIYTKRVPGKNLVLVRPVEHSNGTGFCVKRGPFRIDSEHYGTSWIETPEEYRVWFAWNKTLCAKRAQVVKDGDTYVRDPEAVTQEYPCRSSWGYIFEEQVPVKLHEDTLKAARQIGLTTGAADILVKDGKFIFLELNSAPTVDDDLIKNFYVEAINSNLMVPV